MIIEMLISLVNWEGGDDGEREVNIFYCEFL